MPYKKAGSFRAPAYLVDIEFARLERIIRAGVQRGLDKTTSRAHVAAVTRAPVRKIFKGGRQHTRKLSTQESIVSLLQLGLNQSEAVRYTNTYGARRQVVTRNRANSIYGPNSTFNARIVDQLTTNRLAYQPYERRLTSRGRYELASRRALSEVTGLGSVAQARRFLGKGAINDEPVEQVGGSLRRSIRVEEGNLRNRVIAGNERVYYAKYVEFGTRHAAAQPFLRPALKVAEKNLRRDVLEALGKVGTPGG